MSNKALKFWSLTISCNFRELCSVERVCSVLTEFGAQWCFQLERGTSNGKLHYQVRLILCDAQKFETLLTILEARFYDRRDITVCPESNNSIQQGGLAFYVMKDETKVDGPWHDPTYRTRKFVPYTMKDLKMMETPLPFQQSILDACALEPDDRTINWVANFTGCAGKSKLMKYMRMMPGYDMARISLGSATQIKTSIIGKGPHRIYMVDLPKVRGSDERVQELFSAIEEIKNGWVESPMYGKSDQELLMEPPHVWIFSNELPNLSFCSLDRWRVHTIDGQQLRPYVYPSNMECQFSD